MPLPLAEFRHGDLRILGTSLAGEESFAIVPELNIAFDFGRAPRELIGIDHVFLTHGHMDHAAGVAYYFSQRMFVDLPPGNLYAPGALIEPIQHLLKTWADIDGQEPPARLHGAQPGQDIPIRRDLIVRPFKVVHPCRRPGGRVIESLGYAAIEIRRKLKDEFHDRTGPQLVELKKNGVEITRRVEIPLVAYCGDTAVGDFLELDYVRNARVLLLECTFVEADHVDRARAGCHIHIRDLRRLLPRLANERILLTHLSRRTLLHQARETLRRELGDADKRVSFLMDARRRRRGPRTRPNDAKRDSP